ncbi:MAG: cytochrome c3 family protein [Calditrichia bacterium]
MKRPKISLLISGYFIFFILVIIVIGFFWIRNKRTPEQPIAFQHNVHVQLVGLKCTFCHDKVEKSTFAGIPPVQKCMSCHKAVRTESPEIQKLTDYWNKGKPVPWKRVYRIPARNYVHFNHKRHIKAGLDCSKCHGEVKLMEKIEQVRKLEMGWCVSCHRENNAPTDCVTCHK